MLEMVGKQKYFQWYGVHQLLGYYTVTVIIEVVLCTTAIDVTFLIPS